MDPDLYLPKDPERDEWDVVVVGTGMGGATVGYELARLGRRVLFLEKGFFLHAETDRGGGRLDPYADNRPETRLRRGWWPLPIHGKTSFGEADIFFSLGCGSGGSTSLYGSALERLAPCDLRPKANFPTSSGSTLPEEWPISYDTLVPYYRRAEVLFRVHGSRDPLDPAPDAELPEPPPLSERDRGLHELFTRAGLHPYRVHVGFEFLPGCEECGGAICPRGCRSDAGRICLVPAVSTLGAKLLPECEVLSLEAGPSSVDRVRCRWRGRELAISARVVVLAAGSMMTPILLLNSRSESWPDGIANRSGLVGRNLMMHTGDFVAIRPRRGGSDTGPKKSLAFNDFYFIGDKKLGTFQAVGLSVSPGVVLGYLRSLAERDPKWWRRLTRPFLRLVAHAAAFYFRNAVVFANIVEDLPYYENRVLPDPRQKGGLRFEYHYSEELRERNFLFREHIERVLGRRHVMRISGENNLNYGHMCGTCRFGSDAETSVLDETNRAHDVENLYVADASFFPSSGGVNPSLTIAANALRVAEIIDRRLA